MSISAVEADATAPIKIALKLVCTVVVNVVANVESTVFFMRFQHANILRFPIDLCLRATYLRFQSLIFIRRTEQRSRKRFVPFRYQLLKFTCHPLYAQTSIYVAAHLSRLYV